jgi:hypothetical protein
MDESENNSPAETIAFNQRRQQVMDTFGDIRMKLSLKSNLEKYWVDELQDGFDLAVSRAKKHGKTSAMVVQFADGALHYQPDAEFADIFLQQFGAHANLPDNSILNASSNTIGIIASYPGLPKHNLDFQGWKSRDSIPPGSLIISDDKGRSKYLVIETKIDGVRLLIDGSAVTSPAGGFRQMRPMLLVEFGSADIPIIYEEPEPVRKTWMEVHGRSPNNPNSGKSLGQRQWEKEMLDPKGDEFIARAKGAWRAEPKSGDEIKVTPAKLKPNPILESEEARINAVDEAYTEAKRHAYYSERDKASKVVGATAHGFAIMTEVLGMSADEISKDTEALADLVEYLRQVARATDGVLGPSSILPPAEDGNNLEELAALIDETWVLPQEIGMRGPFMYDRVNWNRNQGQSPISN